MTLTLSWWVFSAGLLVTAIALVVYGGSKPRGDYDMVTGLLELALAFACVAGAIGIAIGHFVR